MKSAFLLTGLLPLLAGSFLLASERAEDITACEFSVQGDHAKPAITGPDNVTSEVHVLQQPDSPIEIMSIDFEGSYLWIADEQFTWEPNVRMRVRNRSDQTVNDWQISVHVRDPNGGIGRATRVSDKRPGGLLPGQAIELRLRGGKGQGGAKGNRVDIIVLVEWTDLSQCRYYPSFKIHGRLSTRPLPWITRLPSP